MSRRKAPENPTAFVRAGDEGDVAIFQRGKVYWLVWTEGGIQHRQTTKKTTYIDAQVEAKKIVHRLKTGSSPISTAAEIKNAHLEYEKQNARPATYEDKVQVLNFLFSKLDPKSIDDLTPSVVERAFLEARDRKKKPWSARTCNKARSYVRRMISWAIERDLIDHDPLAKLTRQKGEKKKDRRALQESELAALLDATPEPWRMYFKFLSLTGLRSREFLTLDWSSVARDNSEIVVFSDRNKSGRRRAIPLHPILRAYFSDRRAVSRFCDPDALIFTHPEKPKLTRFELLDVFKRSASTANLSRIRDLDVHSLRKTFCTNLARAGVPPRAAQELMGHASIQMTLAIYTEVDAGDLKIAIAKLKNPTDPSNFITILSHSSENIEDCPV